MRSLGGVPLALRVPLLVLAALGGAACGVAGSFVHALTMGGIPVGELTALSLSVAFFVLAGLALSSRSGVLAAGAGWLAVTVVMTRPRPEGDLVVPNTVLGNGWLIGGTLLAFVALAGPYARHLQT